MPASKVRNILVAACDADLLGKTLKYGKVNFEIRRDFYGGELVQVEDAVDLIKTAGGKYVAPQEIENKLKIDPFVSQAVVIGDRGPAALRSSA
jgi:hypothetical protein